MEHSRLSSSALSRALLFLLPWIGACGSMQEAPPPSMPTKLGEQHAADETQAAPDGRSAAREPASSPAATPGSPGIGDELFPTAGNGGYDVQSYDLSISIDDADGPIDATATIRAKSTQALSRFDFDLHGLDVHSIDIDGSAATFAREADELVVTPAKSIANGAEFTTIVRYGGKPDGVLDPAFPLDLKLGWIVKDGEVYVLSEPTGAKSFFPCNDHPRDKALYTIRLTVPKPLIAVSNGALAETIDAGEKRTFVYRPRDPIATYLVTIAIGAFDVNESKGQSGLPIHNYYSPKSKASLRKNFENTAAIVQFLSDTFGAYPFETCGNIVSNLDLPGALETQTLPTFGANIGGASTICHELAHQWFGDSVSVAEWSDIWLNEGFAEYAAWMYLESTKGRENLEKHAREQYGFYRAMTERPPAQGEDSSEPHESDSASEPPPGKPTIKSMFGAGVYVRGPLALHALRTEVGDDEFLRLMRSWVADHRNGNASIADFLAHVERTATPAARALLERWIFDPKMPHVAVFDDELAKEKAERDAKRKAREEERQKQHETEKKDGGTQKSGG
jgi:aminopeptidase N